MTELLLSLAIAFAPDTPALVTQIGAPSFRQREQAQRILARRMSWALAMRLEKVPAVNGEAARRIDRLVTRYWSLPEWSDCPHIDSLCEPNCMTCTHALARHYFRRAKVQYPGDWGSQASYPTYRLATWIMLDDLRRWRIPPAVVRPLLAAMRLRSDQWEIKRR